MHPLGLALEIIIKDDGKEQLGGIWDYRDDEEGIYYNITNSDNNRKERFKNNEKFIDTELKKRTNKREELFGSLIEKLK